MPALAGGCVWITRAEPGAGETADRLRALGYEPLVAPVLEVRRTCAIVPDLNGIGALAFTSANGVRAFAEACPRRDRPVFTVGDATAAAAAQAGFSQVSSAGGDVAALARLISARRDGLHGPVLHPCALEPAGDLAGALARSGVAVLSAPLYQTVGVSALPEAAGAALAAGTVDLILLHSPKAGRVLAGLLDGLAAECGRVRLAGLSHACLAPLTPFGFASRTAPTDPREDALLALLSR